LVFRSDTFPFTIPVGCWQKLTKQSKEISAVKENFLLKRIGSLRRSIDVIPQIKKQFASLRSRGRIRVL
jgi:hypothetical protein